MCAKTKKAKLLFWIILFSTIVRGLIAAFIELGNDEVYYINYALFPDWSHFDHPPMVGFVIQLFSLDLLFQDEFFIRLGSIVFGSINTYLIFLIGKKIKNEITGLFAALLFTASIYCFIIAGTFILPDTPQLIFWLLSLYFLLNALPAKHFSKFEKINLILAGIMIGLAMLSKYTAVFLWLGAGLYILFFNVKWLKKKELYISVILSFIFFLPVLIWNYNNDFMSFTFQSERVDVSDSLIRFDYFLTELSGQIFYNNPVNFAIILVAIIALLKGKKFISPDNKRILLFISLPLIIVFLIFSLFRSTLPHWTSPGYLGLILISAAYLEDIYSKKKVFIPLIIKFSVFFLGIIVILGFFQINYGLLYRAQENNPGELGKNDVTLDLYGWDQLKDKFEEIYKSDINENRMTDDVVIISYRWFPAANIDYYVARPLGLKLFAMGKIERIHKYARINNFRGGFKKGMDA